MNKTQLVDALAERIGDRRTAVSAVDAMLETIVDTVRAGGAVSISGFGVFEGRARASRVARNPRTGETVAVPATTVPAFRAGLAFRSAVGGGQPAARTAAPRRSRSTPSAPTPPAATPSAAAEVTPLEAAAVADAPAKIARGSGRKAAAAKAADVTTPATRTAAKKTADPKADKKATGKKAADRKAATKKPAAPTSEVTLPAGKKSKAKKAKKSKK